MSASAIAYSNTASDISTAAGSKTIAFKNSGSATVTASANVNMSGSLETTTIAGSELQAEKIYTIWFDSSTTTKVKYHIIIQK